MIRSIIQAYEKTVKGEQTNVDMVGATTASTDTTGTETTTSTTSTTARD